MALFRSFNEPSLSLRGFFSCCYGGRNMTKSPDHEPHDHPKMDNVDGIMASRENGHDDSDDEERQNFEQVKESHSAYELPPDEGPKIMPDEDDYNNQENVSLYGDQASDAGSEGKEQSAVKCCLLEVVLKYDSKKFSLNVKVGQTRELIPPRRGVKYSGAQVRMTLLGDKTSKEIRKKTSVCDGDNPQFDELFDIHTGANLEHLALRFRLYGCERLRRKVLLGESIIRLNFLKDQQRAQDEHKFSLPLEPRIQTKGLRKPPRIGDDDIDDDYGSDTGYSDTASSMAASTLSLGMSMQPELFISLAHNGLTGRLSVEIIKGSGFRLAGMTRAPDTYVKLSIMSQDGHVVWKAKTNIVKNQSNPMYKEPFMFPVALFQLTDFTLVVSVYMKKSMNRREMLGWFSTGKNNSGEEELAHWQDMKELKGEAVCRWHVLLEPSQHTS